MPSWQQHSDTLFDTALRAAASQYQRLPSEGKLSPGEDAPYAVIAACSFPDSSLRGNDKGERPFTVLLTGDRRSFPSLPAAGKGSAPRFPREQILLCRSIPASSERQGCAVSFEAEQCNTEGIPRKQQVWALTSQIRYNLPAPAEFVFMAEYRL